MQQAMPAKVSEVQAGLGVCTYYQQRSLTWYIRYGYNSLAFRSIGPNFPGLLTHS